MTVSASYMSSIVRSSQLMGRSRGRSRFKSAIWAQKRGYLDASASLETRTDEADSSSWFFSREGRGAGAGAGDAGDAAACGALLGIGRLPPPGTGIAAWLTDAVVAPNGFTGVEAAVTRASNGCCGLEAAPSLRRMPRSLPKDQKNHEHTLYGCGGNGQGPRKPPAGGS